MIRQTNVKENFLSIHNHYKIKEIFHMTYISNSSYKKYYSESEILRSNSKIIEPTHQ